MQVGLFISCLTDTFHPRVGAAVVAVLRHHGCPVRFPTEQTCCGQPAYNNGLHREAARFVLRTAQLFAEDEFVVSPSSSCVTTLRQHGPELFPVGSEERAMVDRLAGKLHDFASFMVEVLNVNSTALAARDPAHRTTYHYPCHLREHLDCETAIARAQRLAGTSLVVLDRVDQCCGFGGAFAVEHAAISGAMLEDKIACLEATGAEVLICDESGCRMNIEGGLHRRGRSVRVVHTAELIAEALGLPLPEVT